jgi:hypothetical protein
VRYEGKSKAYQGFSACDCPIWYERRKKASLVRKW